MNCREWIGITRNYKKTCSLLVSYWRTTWKTCALVFTNGVPLFSSSPWNSHEKKRQTIKHLQWQKHPQSDWIVNPEISTGDWRQHLFWCKMIANVPMQREDRERKSQNQDQSEYAGLEGRECTLGGVAAHHCTRDSGWKKRWQRDQAWGMNLC